MSKPKQILCAFRDCNQLVKVDDTVYVVWDDKRWNKDSELYVVKIGRELISVSDLKESHPRRDTQFYAKDGRLKADYGGRAHIYSSKEGYEEWLIQSITIKQCRDKFYGYGEMPELTYDKACRILKILEET